MIRVLTIQRNLVRLEESLQCFRAAVFLCAGSNFTWEQVICQTWVVES